MSAAGELRDHLLDRVVPRLEEILERYVAQLEAAIEVMDAVAKPPNSTDGEAEEARSAVRRRFRYAGRFRDTFAESLFDEADRARAMFFVELDGVAEPPTLPESVPAGAGDPAPELVRPGLSLRLRATLRPKVSTDVAVHPVAELYLAELGRRLEPVANDVARLTALAVARIRWQLHLHTELDHDEAEPPQSLADAAVGIRARLRSIIDDVADEFGQALGAAAIHVPEGRAGAIRTEAANRRAELLDAWTSFEETLSSNVGAEAVLARALAAIEAAVADAARSIEEVRDRYGETPLEAIGVGLDHIGERAASALDGDGAPVLESLATEAVGIFREQLPRIDGLIPRLEEEVAALEAELEAVPGQVPDDLHISEHPVPEIPAGPRRLQLKDAPLEQLLNTACSGTLPRWLEKNLATAQDEMDALSEELTRIRNAVQFQLRAPTKGGFSALEVRELVAGITDRAVAQLEDLRVQGLASVDAFVTGLEARARHDTDALRSAVANREFMRIHSEIAEEQAVRQIATGMERVRGAAEGLGHGARTVLATAGKAVTAIQDWAERQLGVDEVEREEMLTSLEQSIIGQGQQVVRLPPLYRQLFDVEADVPWDELLVPREEELDVIRRGYERWVEDRSSTVAVVGEKGSGKSTLLRLAEQHVFGETRVVRTSLGRTMDDPVVMADQIAAAFGLEDGHGLADAINRQPAAVTIVEDVHHLFIRALGGFEAIEAFMELVAATSENVLWVVTVDELAWRYLNRVVGLEAHFVHKVSTTNLPADKLERAIMARHEVSGFALRFESEGSEATESRWSRILRREAKGELTRKESQRKLFFHDLAGIAEGNIVLALFYWLRSIRRMDDHVLVLGEPEIIDLEFLERLPLAQLHTIAAIILHGGLSEAAHQRVFQLPAAESRLQLAALADSHMIFLARDGEYKINKVLYRPFIRLLASKNIF
ncbi:MAG: hypothetical protein R3314_04780 [Longimicrobiales bacterium]|nr:hypothetical protein [Longimicrobiales bacterium]